MICLFSKNAKNPRSFEQTISRVSKEATEVDGKMETADFLREFGPFLFSHFSDFADTAIFKEMKAKYDELAQDSKAVDVVEVLGKREGEIERECCKGNEWACQVLGL